MRRPVEFVANACSLVKPDAKAVFAGHYGSILRVVVTVSRMRRP
jgi:hypothetical protein